LLITGWLDTIELEPGEPPLAELVIHLFLTKAAEAQAHRWIEAWLVDGRPPAAMQELIAATAVLVEG
jgi:hypothetical protein